MISFTFPPKKFEHIIRDLLLNKGKRVTVYEKCEKDPDIKLSGSPGNYQDFEDIIMSDHVESANSAVLAIQVLHKQVDSKFLNFSK